MGLIVNPFSHGPGGGGGGGGGPTASAGADRTAFVNETLSLDGTASTGAYDGLQADGKHSIQWSFDYGGWTYQGGLTAPIAFPEAGVYNVSLTLYDAAGTSSSDTTQVTVSAITLGSEETLTDTGNPVTNMTNLQAAIDGSLGTANKVITLPAGFVARGTLILKHRTSATYCTIRTANHASLPDGKSRVVPSDASDMAIIEVSGSADIIQTPATSSNPARYYYFLGIHFRKQTSSTAYTHTFVNLGQGNETATNQLVNHIVFDRCYWDGGSTTSDTLRGIGIRGNDISVVNSYLHRFKGTGIETQAIWFAFGERIACINNFIEGGSENTMSGGGDHSITGLTVNDCVFRRNHAKKDLGWRSGDPAYYGVDMSIKNIFEMKWGNRWSVEGNRFEDHWLEDQNYAITITVRNQGGGCPWAVVQYLDFSHNQIVKMANGMSISGADDLQTSQYTNHIIVRHNVWAGVRYYNGQWLMWLVGGGIDRLSIIRNSTDLNGDVLSGVGKTIEFSANTGNTNFAFLANITQAFFNHDVGGRNLAAFQAACTSFDVRKNGFYRQSTGTIPTDNTTVSALSDVKYTNVAAFDLSLAGDSPFLTTGLGGARAGADVATVNSLCANCVTGAW